MQITDDVITCMLKPLELEPTPESIARVRAVVRTGTRFTIHHLGLGGDGMTIRWIEDGDDVGARAPAGSWASSDETAVIAIADEPIVYVVVGRNHVLGLRTQRRWRAMS